MQTVRNGIRAFNAQGVGSLVALSSRPRSAAPSLVLAELEERLRAILHQSPRSFGQARSTWTLALLAEVAQRRADTSGLNFRLLWPSRAA